MASEPCCIVDDNFQQKTERSWRCRGSCGLVGLELGFGIGFKKNNQFFPIVFQKITDCSDYCPFKYINCKKIVIKILNQIKKIKLN